MGLKVLDTIEAIQHRREPVIPDIMSYEFYKEEVPHPNFATESSWYIGLRLGCRLSGPEDSKHHLMKHMRYLIAEELYGEVIDEVRDTIHSLYKKAGYTRYKDEIEKLHKLIDKMQGNV